MRENRGVARPLIGITAWQRTIDIDFGRRRPAITTGREYFDAVAAAGGVPVLVAAPGDPDELLERLDGLLLAGGEDVEPWRYGAEPEPGRDYAPERDAFELALVRGARERRLPTLAICRGLQLTNVAFGGSLVVDLGETGVHGRVDDIDAHNRVRHDIELAPDSRLAALYATTTRTVNSLHHQAADRVAPGFRAVAWAPDGTIEAIECDDATWPFWAVQWHPEKLVAPDEWRAELPLFAALVRACGARVGAP